MTLELSVLCGAMGEAWWESTCEAAYIAKKSCNCSGFKCVGCPSLATCNHFIWHVLFSHGHVASHRGLAVPLQLCKFCSSPASWHGKEKKGKRSDFFHQCHTHPCWVQLAGKGRGGMKLRNGNCSGWVLLSLWATGLRCQSSSQSQLTAGSGAPVQSFRCFCCLCMLLRKRRWLISWPFIMRLGLLRAQQVGDSSLKRHETEGTSRVQPLRRCHATASWDGLFLAQVDFFRDENRKCVRAVWWDGYQEGGIKHKEGRGSPWGTQAVLGYHQCSSALGEAYGRPQEAPQEGMGRGGVFCVHFDFPLKLLLNRTRGTKPFPQMLLHKMCKNNCKPLCVMQIIQRAP